MALLPYNSVVTTPAASKDLTILATVKDEMGFTTIDVARDILLSVMIQQASSKAVELSRREFAAETMTDSFRADYCGSTVQLVRRPIVHYVRCRWRDLAGTDYEIISGNGWLQRIDASGNPQSWAGKIVVVYVAGYTLLTEESHALERIVIDEVKLRYSARSRDPLLKGIDVDGVARLDYWVDRSGSGGGTGQIDPMLAALSQQGFVDAIA
jgi:hypothetical protein